MPASHDLNGLMKFLSRDEWRDCFEDALDNHFGPVLDAGTWSSMIWPRCSATIGQ